MTLSPLHREALRLRCEKSTQSDVARRLGVSRLVLSLLLAGHYRWNAGRKTAGIEQRIAEKFPAELEAACQSAARVSPGASVQEQARAAVLSLAGHDPVAADPARILTPAQERTRAAIARVVAANRAGAAPFRSTPTPTETP